MTQGVLYVVATPIGNLDDITLRALNVLRSVDGVLAEDTRRTATLLRHFSIRAALTSLHDHNERERAQSVCERLQGGQSLALVSDAGTPLISDPGFYLVRAVRAQGARVVPVPGACAAIAALCAGALPTDRFVFEGFLPSPAGARAQRLQSLASEPRTIVFYESPHRITQLLEDLAVSFDAHREAVLARELTKMYEEFVSGTVAELANRLREGEIKVRGEMVLVLRGYDAQDADPDSVELDRVLDTLLEELPLKQAASLAARLCGVKRNAAYARALARNALHD
ncbi:MAG: 16S rRNA (cytidine1402-2'-O)-methyltransferase [Gammaproteobacteria bacterium]